MSTWIEHLETRKLLSGYTVSQVANFATVGLKNPTQTIVHDGAGDIFGIAGGGANGDGAVWEIPFSTKVLKVAASFDVTNGDDPSSGLSIDSAGNIFGACSEGGANKMGTVWELPSGQSSIMLLGSFSSSSGSGANGQIYVDSSGNIFGTNEGEVQGPAYGNIWEYSASTGAITDLADFQEFVSGANPHGGLISDGNGNFFGTAYNGGVNDDGTVWKYSLGDSSITELADFDDASAGANPEGGIAMDSSGDLFGTSVGPTNSDSDDNVWELTTGSHTITTLAFFPIGKGLVFFGAAPSAPVILDSKGDVLGTTEFGGTTNQGDVFAIHPGVNQLLDLHPFTFAGGHDPDSSLLLDSAGDIFGTTQLGGTSDDGTAFVMIPPGNVAPTHLAFSVQPVNTGANGVFTANVVVNVEGVGNQTAATDNSAVTLNIGKGPTGAALGGAVTVNAVDGIATFPGLSLDESGTFTLKATDGSLKSATSKSFVVPTNLQLVIAQQPVNTTAGTKMNPPIAIDVEDQFGKLLTTGHSSVKLAIQTGPAMAKLQGFTAPAAKGVATFKSFSTTKAGTYFLTASDGTATQLTLDPFMVNPAAVSKMLFSTQPIATSEGTAFSVAVQLVDRYGNVATNDTSNVTLSLAVHPAGVLLDGTLIEPVIDGLADFVGLSIATPGSYELLASDSGAVKPVKSVKFAVG